MFVFVYLSLGALDRLEARPGAERALGTRLGRRRARLAERALGTHERRRQTLLGTERTSRALAPTHTSTRKG